MRGGILGRNMSEPTPAPTATVIRTCPEAGKPVRHPWVRRILVIGWTSIFLSAVCLLAGDWVATTKPDTTPLVWGLLLMGARLFGLTSFTIGVVAVFNHRWTQGILLLLLAVGLPIAAFLTFGTI